VRADLEAFGKALLSEFRAWVPGVRREVSAVEIEKELQFWRTHHGLNPHDNRGWKDPRWIPIFVKLP
jgi:hypothetical protein